MRYESTKIGERQLYLKHKENEVGSTNIGKRKLHRRHKKNEVGIHKKEDG